MINKALLTGVLLVMMPLILASTPSLSIDKNQVTVSGISSGAQMAHQLHIAYPEIFSGVGLIAGGPFGCANGSLETAITRCMGSTNGELPLDLFEAQLRAAATESKVGDTALLADDKIWIFHGRKDTTVAAGLSDAIAALYGRFVMSENIQYVNNIESGHNYPTQSSGTECASTESPFIGNCNYDAAGNLLQQLYGKLNAPATEVKTELTKVTLPGAAEAGMDKDAYLFIPDACIQAGRTCKTHLVLHGCAQSAVQLDRLFIKKSGYLPWAESNDIVLAFPQVVPATVNPYACWDWWGYTGSSYRWRDGAQMAVLANWVQELSVR